MSKYQNSKVYKIVSNCNPELVYYGSTYTTLSRRLSGHKGHYKLYLKEKYNYVTSFELLKLEHFEIILVESYPCDNVEELRKRERYYIENNLCVNKFIPSRTDKERHKIYYENNKEQCKEKNKQYREDNKEKAIEYNKIYYKNNKEKERERGKKYRENISSKPITCDGGRDMARASLNRHLKRKIHFNKMINYLQL